MGAEVTKNLQISVFFIEQAFDTNVSTI